ncbi:MAG: glucosaminidase domain-containing protein [Oscillospiraceae bacterium]|nr:glucosaminidase domain-containing protein [Oscillospiraceae bacterium]
MKKAILPVLISAVCASAYVTVSADSWQEKYPWATESIQYCIDNGILSGDESGDLMLAGNLTRAQMAKIFTDTFALSADGTMQFDDVYEDNWSYSYVLAFQDYMPKKGVSFSGDEYVTREEFAASLVKASGQSAASSYTITNYNFDDASEVDDAYKNLLETAVLNLYLRGDNGSIRPKDLLTRAEACAFLYRVVNPAADKTSITGEAQVTLEQAQAWAASKGAADRFIEIAPVYWYYGEQFGIRPEVMYAQAGKETAYGNYGGAVLPEMNNWAGIKTKDASGDTTEDHETFDTPEDGVRGHYNHMSAYVGLAPIGEPHGRYYVVLTTAWAGTIKFVEQLGGRWCPNINYGYEIIDMIDNMKTY